MGAWFRVSHDVVIKMLARITVIQGLTGLEDLFPSP